jgi:hypothetical protein
MAEPIPEATTTSADAAPAAAPAEDEGPGIAGWWRIDLDSSGLQLWAGATHPLGGGSVALASDIYVFGTFGEFDIGPAITAGPALITPMLGFQADFAAQHAQALVPQLYTIVSGGSVYFESWIQIYLQDMFNDGQMDFFHTRDFLLFNVSDTVGLGPEIDINFALSNKPVNMDGEEKTVYFLPIGPHVKLAYGTGSVLELFVGYDVAAKSVDHDKLAGRFTFVQTF